MEPNQKEEIDFKTLLSVLSDNDSSKYQSYDIVGNTAEIYKISNELFTENNRNTSRRIHIEYTDVDNTLSKTATNYILIGHGDGKNSVINAFNDVMAQFPINTSQIGKMLFHMWYSQYSTESYKQISSLSRCICTLPQDINIIWGFTPDEKLTEGQVKLTLIAVSKDSNQETESCKTN